MKHYDNRDVIEQGPYYTRHVLAMTAESLHEKGDIAAELAHRDMEIDRLRAEGANAMSERFGFEVEVINLRGELNAERRKLVRQADVLRVMNEVAQEWKASAIKAEKERDAAIAERDNIEAQWEIEEAHTIELAQMRDAEKGSE